MVLLVALLVAVTVMRRTGHDFTRVTREVKSTSHSQHFAAVVLGFPGSSLISLVCEHTNNNRMTLGEVETQFP